MLERFLAALGSPVLKLYRETEKLGAFFLFHWSLLPKYFSGPFRLRLVMRQLEVVGFDSLGVILLTGLFTGLVSAIQIYNVVHPFHGEYAIGYAVYAGVGRELGPVFAGLMIISRAISAMTAELGTMRVTEQIDAIDVLSVDSRKYLIVPRIIATVIAVPLLIILFDFIANVGAYLLSVYALGVNPTAYMDMIDQFARFGDFGTGLVKGVVFGFLVAAIGTYIGYFTKGGARGVGLATTNAVVVSSVALFLANYFLSSIFLVLDW